jgi:hypothetical protein
MSDFLFFWFSLPISFRNSRNNEISFYVLAVLGVTDVVGRADDGVAIVTASSVETSLFRTTHSRSDAFVDIFFVLFNLKLFRVKRYPCSIVTYEIILPWQVRLSEARRYPSGHWHE